ncbi:MAG: response regulator [Giesbergeria sp.]|uniref:response regulator transcription factor n=1 Tax=Giesbergeria sp. TaxID=2818473 RepID=UPI00262E901F|nr:response regulator [Giesbergeria sp.]MDD2608586.1 response regulator [Giesbergeria sp.]
MNTIFLCDDDVGVSGALSFLLRQYGFEVQAYSSGPALLAALDALPPPVRGVFLLDVRMDPMSGPEVHEQLLQRGLRQRNPVIFLSGHGDIPMAVAAMAKGALNFVEKPYADDSLIAILSDALAQEAQWQAAAKRAEFLQSMVESLTPQQRRVAVLVAAGDLNKVIAAKLGISERMVEVHRAKVFEKLGVDSAAALATTVADIRACGLELLPPEAA